MNKYVIGVQYTCNRTSLYWPFLASYFTSSEGSLKFPLIQVLIVLLLLQLINQSLLEVVMLQPQQLQKV